MAKPKIIRITAILVTDDGQTRAVTKKHPSAGDTVYASAADGVGRTWRSVPRTILKKWKA